MTATAQDLDGVGLGLRWAFLDEVLDEGAPPSIRFFEVSPENYMRRGGYFPAALERLADRHALRTHGLMLDIGSTDPLDHDYLDALRDFLGRVGARSHSDHLCWSGTRGLTLHDLLPLPTRPDVIAHVVQRVARVQDRLGLPLALENISYYLVPGQSIPEHEWVAEVVERADCGLLLDVNNVWVNAQNHGLDPYAILEALPLDRVVHLHVAGGERLERFDDLVIDTHGTDVGPEVVDLMTWVVERTGPLPVVYERDHDIPSLAELGRQVGALQVAYDAAVARHRRRVEERIRRPRIELAPGEVEGPELAEVESAFTDFIVTREFDAQAVAASTALGGASPARVEVYRRLVRNAMRATIRRFIPRTVARLGEERFDHEVSTWLEAEGPRSKFLRDVPLEFGRFITYRWPGSDLPAYLVDLARHELVEMEVDAAPRRDPVENKEGTSPVQLGLVSKIRFDPAVRIADYDHAVHELAAALDDRKQPPRRATTLLVYRDREHDVRFLALTPFAAALLRQLLDGVTLGDAVRGAASSVAIPLDDALVVRAATLLADLAQRGAALGPDARAVEPGVG